MDAAVIAPGLVAAALALPWLTLLPIDGPLGVIAHALTLIAAFHGAGLLVGQIEGRQGSSPLLVMQWGIAALIAASGLAIVVGIGTLTTHSILVFGGAAVHTSWLGVQFARYVRRVAQALDGQRSWIAPAALLAGLGALLVIGAGGAALARPFDDEGHLLAQLARVLDTGTLADPIGYPRSAQLGAQVALAAIASGAGDTAARVVEPLCLVLALALAVAHLRPRDAGAAVWAVVLLVAASALALAPSDPLPCWTAVGLLLALYLTLDESTPPPALPVALIAGALIALRYELLPIAAVGVAAAWWRRRHDHYRTAMLIGGVFTVGFPFLVTRMLAWRSVNAVAHAQLAAPAYTPLALRILIAAAIAVPAACLLRLILPDSRALRTAATATALGLGGVAAHIAGPGAYTLRLAWPIAIAFVILLVIEIARSRAAGAAALLTALVLCVLIHEGREAPGRLRWSRRMATAATGATYLEPPRDAAAPYAQLLAHVPPDAGVAIWITAPEQLDYAKHRIVDLRTPTGTRLRRHRWDAGASMEPLGHSASLPAGDKPRPSRLERLLAAMSTSYLLLESDDARLRRAKRSWFYRLACTHEPFPVPMICADDLESIALRHPIVAQHDNLVLVDLRR